MRNLWIITGWEFWRHLKSRSFILATFVPPLLFTVVAFILFFFYRESRTPQPRVIGCVELDTTRYCEALQEKLNNFTLPGTGSPAVILMDIQADTTEPLRNLFQEVARLKHELDSLNDAYNRIKERRRYIFQRPNSPTKERLLRQTYEQLHMTREQRDLAEIEFNRKKAYVDSLWQAQILRTADSLLFNQIVEGYLILRGEELLNGEVEFHSIYPNQFLQIEPLKTVLQEFLVEMRLRQEGITISQIHEWLKPVVINEILVEGAKKREFSFLQSYLAPIIVVVFLFISIFTPAGFLFYSLLSEKGNRVLEVLMTSANSFQIIAGKILGLGFLGLVQILIWLLLTEGLILAELLSVENLTFFTLRNLGVFVLYFVLGYFFFAAIYVGIGTVYSDEDEAHHVHLVLRMLSISPILFSVPILMFPNAVFVRILSFIPFLTPTFMILRTPLGHPPEIDYVISIAVMLVSTIVALLVSIRLFRTSSLFYHHRPGWTEVWKLLWGKG
ncbi:MAG: ABC transporter permease [Calditrichaeota bacterium]|nr:ABC transporter permease [Calditrichota bacterium]